MRKLPVVCLISVLCIGTLTGFAAEDKNLIVTSADLKQDYDVITVYSDYQDVTPSFSTNQFERPTMKAVQNVIKLAKDAGADALVGVRIEPLNLSEGHAGRVLVYGTGVKFKPAANGQKK